MNARYDVFGEALSAGLPAVRLSAGPRSKWIRGEAKGQARLLRAGARGLARLALAKTLQHRAAVGRLRRVRQPSPFRRWSGRRRARQRVAASSATSSTTLSNPKGPSALTQTDQAEAQSMVRRWRGDDRPKGMTGELPKVLPSSRPGERAGELNRWRSAPLRKTLTSRHAAMETIRG